MAQQLAVKIGRFGHLCLFSGLEDKNLKLFSKVVVQTDRGLEVGELVSLPKCGAKNATKEIKLKKILKYLDDKDKAQLEKVAKKEAQARELIEAKIKEYELPMRLFSVEVLFDLKRCVFYYKETEEKKSLSLRDLRRDLSTALMMKIELKSLTARDAAKLVGGYGVCGKELCCCAWLDKPRQVSVKMVKQQGLSISPSKTSGACGRLLCCLSYEAEGEHP